MLDKLFNQKEYGADAQAMTSDFFTSVYSYMFMALGISGTIAYMTGTSGFVFKYLISYDAFGSASISPLFYVIAFAPVLLGLGIQFMYNRLSMPLLVGLFMIYSILMGLSLSTIFIVYSIGSIIMTFFVTAGAFGTMAVMGYTTKVDLTKMGSLLYMAFAGIFIASIIRMFMPGDNATFSYIIAIAGVIVFTGLTAYEMQRLKYISQNPELSQLDKRKLSLIGGLMLYILFINLFLSLLRLLGGRD